MRNVIPSTGSCRLVYTVFFFFFFFFWMDGCSKHKNMRLYLGTINAISTPSSSKSSNKLVRWCWSRDYLAAVESTLTLFFLFSPFFFRFFFIFFFFFRLPPFKM